MEKYHFLIFFHLNAICYFQTLPLGVSHTPLVSKGILNRPESAIFNALAAARSEGFKKGVVTSCVSFFTVSFSFIRIPPPRFSAVGAFLSQMIGAARYSVGVTP